MQIGSRATYTGGIRDSKLNGKGIVSFKDKRVLKGTFVDNKCHKDIKYAMPDKSKYVMSYHLGLRNGQYTFKCKEFTVRGQFISNVETGNFTIEYSNGMSYEGGYFNDMKEGKGILMNNGYKDYKGYFKNSMKDGTGVQYGLDYDNGKGVSYKIYSGKFKKG